MSFIEINLIEERLKRKNPTASSREISQHLQRNLFKSLVSSGVASQHLLRELFESLVQKSLIDRASTSGDWAEADMFRSIAEEMLEASSTNGMGFLCHVRDFCNQNDTEDGARFWQHLRFVKDEDGYSPLHRAVIMGFQRVAELLVTGFNKGKSENSKGRPEDRPLEFSDFDVLHARTPEGWTPLHFAAMTEGFDEPVAGEGANEATVTEGAYEDIVDVLVKLYDDIKKPDDEIWDFADNFWMTPLHYAVLANRQAHVKQLLAWEAYGRHVNAGDYHRKSPLHMAVCHPKLSAFTEDLQASKFHQKLLESRTQQPSIELIRTLAECPKVDIHAVDCCLYTPLHWAVHVGNTDTVKCLVSLSDGKRVRATLKDIKGRPVMQMATENTAVEEKAKRSDQRNWEYFNGGGGNQMDESLIDRDVFEDIQQVLLTCDDVKDDMKRLYRDRQVFVDAANAILVGAALVAGVTFQGFLQPPTGDGSNEADRQVRFFWWSNSLSFFFSVAAVMAGAAAVLPMGNKVYIGRSVRNLRWAVTITSALLMISASHVLAAFAFSGFASLTTSVSHLERNMKITTSVGIAVCCIILGSFFYSLEKLGPGFSTRAIQLKTLILSTARYIEQQLRRTGRKHRDPALEIIRTNLKDTWYKSWISHRHFSADDAARIDFLIASVFDSEIKDYPLAKLNKVDRQLYVLERVYEKVRNEIYTRDVRTLDNVRFMSGSGLMPREIHFWMNRCPLPLCRAHSLKMDRQRWERIAEKSDAQYKKYYSGT